jgi:hypothetical protein
VFLQDVSFMTIILELAATDFTQERMDLQICDSASPGYRLIKTLARIPRGSWAHLFHRAPCSSDGLRNLTVITREVIFLLTY